MKYIVWRTPFKSYDYAQGDGYFVKYKDKCTDYFSINWFDASKFLTIKGAINRLGLTLNESMKSMDDFFNANEITKSYHRDKVITSVLGDSLDKTISFSRGHIDRIDDDGNFIGNAGEEVLEYVQKYIESNIKKYNNLQKRFTSLGVDNYIDKSTSDEDFWSEVFENK
jgi:hypothetical protein